MDSWVSRGRGTRDQIANICRIMEKAREFQKKTSTSASIATLKPLTMWIIKKKKKKTTVKILKETKPPYQPPEIPVCRSRNNSQNQTGNNVLVQNWECSMTRQYIVTLLI